MNDGLFHELKAQVLDTELCLFCGNCVAVCPVDCIVFLEDGPQLNGECTSCGQCIEACPGIGSPLSALDRLVFGREKTKEEDLCGFGIYMKDRNLISGDKDIFKIGYTGGKITALLAYLLEKKEIDAAIVSHWGEASPFPWFAWPVIATNRKELIKGAGSKYVFSPVLKALKEVALRDDIERVAIVGLGCHLQGLRKLQYLGQPYSRLVDKITVKFGLYCGAPMVRKQDFMKYVSDLCNVPAEEILHVDFKRVSEAFDVVFDVILKNGQKANKKFNLMELFGVLQQHHRWNRCRLCTDYSAEYSDISFGGVHVTTRTSLGEDIVNRAMVDGWLKPSPPNEMFDNVAVQIDRSVAMMKKEQNRKRIADYKQKRKPVPKLE